MLKLLEQYALANSKQMSHDFHEAILATDSLVFFQFQYDQNQSDAQEGGGQEGPVSQNMGTGACDN